MKTQSADDVIANDYFDGHHPSVEGDVEKHEWQLVSWSALVLLVVRRRVSPTLADLANR